ncbi:hypothetical protein N7537_010130 [Penicillium hordei]|uniref:Uncharacterized protein n=1 Tax=Penicillium hordei TaxID=40994 RepID=A0AAD6DUF0_9EURO|nr:uncharacterized protein N7537_010130 [Penicillium hordei]KAJ5593226.1 hypothetical protein N7537_010130 [Penicillium hordei]
MVNYILTIIVDISVELRTSLVEEYANERKPTDGLLVLPSRFGLRLTKEDRLEYHEFPIATSARLIPSLYTFFEDFKYLEAYTYYIKRLYGLIDISIWRTISLIFILPLEEGTAILGVLYAIRYYTLIPPDLKSDDKLLVKSTRSKPDKRAIYEIAKLAY